jgi:predicted DsbA family dithiol-disulfide isomerase
MSVKITYYLEVVSSWCFWAEPAWADLKARYAGKAVVFDWKLALMESSGFPSSVAQCEWFYRRSGTIMRSPFMLSSGWFEPEHKPYLVPNLVAEAARDLGVRDDTVRLAVSRSALREARKVGSWDVAAAVGAQAAGLDATALLTRARHPEVEARARSTTAEFHALQVTQRPAFLLENSIGDRAVFSGLVRSAPVAAAIDALLEDEAAYASHAAHFGAPPLG